MKNYEKPVVLANEELAEGVYAGSGDCYTYTGSISQVPDLGRDYYVVHIDGRHEASDKHHSTGRSLQIVFNQPVTYMSSMGEKVEGSGTSVLTLTFGVGNGSYHHNASDNAGLSDLKLYSEPGLELISVTSTYCNHTCGQHDGLN